jgi:hypothetical protein
MFRALARGGGLLTSGGGIAVPSVAVPPEAAVVEALSVLVTVRSQEKRRK